MSVLLWLVAAMIVAAIVWIYTRKKEGLNNPRTQYSFKPGTNYGGNDLFQTAGPGIDGCINICSERADCAGFVSNKRNQDINTWCYYKTAMNGNGSSDGGANSWVKKQEKIEAPAYSYNLNTTYWGDDLNLLYGDWNFCKQKCDETEQCGGFVNVDGTYCYLKTQLNDGPRGQWGANSVRKEKFGFCPDGTPKFAENGWNCNFKFPDQKEEGWIFPGRDVAESSVWVNNADECAYHCKNTKHKNGEVCRAYSYNKNDHQCYLKYGVFTAYKDPNWTSAQGSHSGVCENDPAVPKLDAEGSNCKWVLTDDNVFNDYTINGPNVHDGGVDFQGNDFTSNKNECLRRCKSTPECKAINLNNAGTKCYMKTRVDSITRQGNSKAYLIAPKGKCEGTNIPKFDDNGSNCQDRMNEVLGSNLGGMDIYHTTADKEECKKLCLIRSDCKSYSWDKNNTCYLKNGVPAASFNSNFDSGVRTNYGVCPDNKTMKMDDKGTNCFGKCPTGDDITQVYKTKEGDTCYGVCPNDSTKFKTNKDGTECFGKCTVGDKTLWKIDEVGSNCFGKCENDDTLWKMDASGSKCHGTCENDSTVFKMDASGTNCYGRCPAPNSSKWKTDPSGSECFGYCANNPDILKIDEVGSNCFGKCENDETKWKMDESGSKCFGKCTVGNTSIWKIDEEGSNCFGKCTKGPDREIYKIDAAGSNCWGSCPEDIGGYKLSERDMCYGECPKDIGGFKQTPDDTCYGICPEGTEREGQYKTQRRDDCGTAGSASNNAENDLEATLNEIEGDDSGGDSSYSSWNASDSGSSGASSGGSGGTSGSGSGSTSGSGSSGGSGSGSSGSSGSGSSGSSGSGAPISRTDDSRLPPWDGTTKGSTGFNVPDAYNEPAEVAANEPAACSGTIPYESKWYAVDSQPVRKGVRRGALQTLYS